MATPTMLRVWRASRIFDFLFWMIFFFFKRFSIKSYIWKLIIFHSLSVVPRNGPKVKKKGVRKRKKQHKTWNLKFEMTEILSQTTRPH